MKTNSHLYDAIVVGAGPNGLAAAIELARAGRAVLVLEAKDTIGGGARTAELTLPGFRHDICSAIHPLSLASPFLRTLPLTEHGLKWIFPPAALAHPFDDGAPAVVERSVQAASETLEIDAQAYRRLMEPLVENWQAVIEDMLGPLPVPPRHPIVTARFGLQAIQSARGLAEKRFKGQRARGLFAGMSAHSMLSLETPISAAFGLMLGMLAHGVGWPVPQGGSQAIVDAMTSYLKSLGGEVVTGTPVQSITDLPEAGAVLFDVTPRQLLRIAGDCFPSPYRRQLERYRYGPGVFKLDLALAGPIPWKAAECARAGTVHLGGTLDEIAAAERSVWRGEHPVKPFVLLAQPSLFDPTRAPAGKHTVWAYCHVPHGSTMDMTERILNQIERFAPRFRDLILASSSLTAAEMEAYNPNYVGGDINGGVQDLWQLFTRPVPRWTPYSTPSKGIYLCSSSTPPGGGVHGMCGYYAARAVLRSVFNASGKQ
jgi:phytoene dehydrogenase-like protein